MTGEDFNSNSAEQDSKPSEWDDMDVRKQTAPEEADAPAERGKNAGENNEREKSRAEQRLDVARERLNQINEEMSSCSLEKESIEEKLDVIEGLIDKNTEEHEGLSIKAEELEREVKNCKRGILSKISKFAKTAAKALAFGRFDEIQKFGDDLKQEGLKGEKAQGLLDENQEALDKNEAEGEKLANEFESEFDRLNSIDNRNTRLAQQKERLEREIEQLEEQVANEAWEEAINDAKGGLSTRSALRGLNREINQTNQVYDAEMAERNSILEQAGAIIRENDDRPGAASNAGRVEAAARYINEKKDAERAEIIGDLDRRANIIKSVGETDSIKGALLRLKRKVMMRLRGMA